MYLYAGGGVGGRRHFLPGGYVAAHSVLGGEQRHKLDSRSLMQYVDRRFQARVNSGGICQQPYPLPFQRGETAVGQHFDARPYLRHRCGEHSQSGNRRVYSS